MIPTPSIPAPFTNTANADLATKLSAISTDNLGVGQGTMTSIVVKKVGTTVGAQAYGDDTVHVLLWTGFHYNALAERSHQKLQRMWEAGSLFKDLLKEGIDAGVYDATLEDASLAVQEVNATLLRNLRAAALANTDNLGPVWRPLTVNGEVILGAKEYIGKNPEIPYGSIYLDGVKLGERIVIPAQFAKPPVKSKPKTVLKNLLMAKLPVGLYARYRLSTENLRDIRIGSDAAVHAKKAGVTIEPDNIRSLFKIAV